MTSIRKHISVIVFYFIQVEKANIFTLERMLRVVCLLVLDILQCCANNGLAHRECSVATLPFELRVVFAYCFYPSAAVSLHFFDNMGNALVFGQQEEDVYMVASSTGLYHSASCGVDQLTYVCMYAFQMLLAKMSAGCLDVKYHMDVYLT